MNVLKTALLLGALSGIVLGAGYYLGGQSGIVIAFLITFVMNVGSYWFSDKIVLAMYGGTIVTEAEQPTLHRIVDDLIARSGMLKPKLALVNLPVPNAFATGRNQRHAVVAVTPSILQLLDERELRAVIAHELGHVKNRDILISSIAATLAGVISYLAQMVMWGGALFGGRDRNGGALGAIAFVILTPIMAAIIQMAISRSREYGADEAGAKMSGSPQDLANALRKLEQISHRMPLEGQPRHEATAHLFIVNPFRASWLMQLFSTHPPMEERIARLETMAQSRMS